MEKKDWKKKLRELSFMKGYYFKLDDNGLVEKKDDQLVFRREELEYFISQELDKAREEGKREGYRCPYCMFTVSTAGQLRHHIQVRHKKEFEFS
jgi:hypothetical protein